MAQRLRSDLRDYQVDIHNFVKTKRRGMVLALMGSGKTAATGTAILDIVNAFMARHVLIVAPIKVCKRSWPDEMRLWAHLQGLKLSLILGDEKQRIAAAEADADVYLINDENFAWLTERYAGLSVLTPRQQPGESKDDWLARKDAFLRRRKKSHLKPKQTGENRWKWKALVLDDTKGVKNRDSLTFYCLRHMAPHFHYLIELTGTPTPQGYENLWSQMYLIDGGKRLGATWTEFKNRYFEESEYTRELTIRPGAKEEIDALIADKVIVVENYEGLPPLVEIDHPVTLPDKVLAAYKEFEREQVLALPDGEVTANSASALANKLLQYANGFVYGEDDSGRRIAYSSQHEAKLDALEELVDAANGKPILVAYAFQEDIAAITGRFKKAVVLDKEGSQIAAWNRGEISMLVMHPASGGHGTNLQDSTNILVWYGLNASTDLVQQFNARLARQGQKESRVIAYYLVAQNTYDERYVQLARIKGRTQSDFIASVKALAEKYRTSPTTG